MRLAAAAFVLALLGSALPPHAKAAQSAGPDDPIVLATNHWASQQVLAAIAGRMLERLGYSVEFKATDPRLQFVVLGVGDVHVQVEVRHSTMAEAYLRELRAGGVVEAGRHQATTSVGWWYPLYVQQRCPGLPRWEALKMCARIFAASKGMAKGRLLAGPAAWETGEAERIEGLRLDLVVENAADAETLWARLEEAIKRKRPVLAFNWSPGWVEAEFPGRFVELPAYDRNCERDPAWGPVADAVFDCGYRSNEPISKAVWSGLPGKWPCAYRLLQRMSLTTRQFSELEHLVERRRLHPDTAAAHWLEHNEPVWREWMPGCRK